MTTTKYKIFVTSTTFILYFFSTIFSKITLFCFKNKCSFCGIYWVKFTNPIVHSKLKINSLLNEMNNEKKSSRQEQLNAWRKRNLAMESKRKALTRKTNVEKENQSLYS